MRVVYYSLLGGLFVVFCLLYLFNVIVILLVILLGIDLVSVVYACFWVFDLLLSGLGICWFWIVVNWMFVVDL